MGLTPGGCGGGPRIVDMRDPVKNVAFLPPHWTSIHVSQGFQTCADLARNVKFRYLQNPCFSLSSATKASFLWSLFHQIPSQFALFPKSCDEEWIDMLIFQLKFTNYMLHNCIHPEPIRLYIYWTHIQGSLGSCHVQNWHPYPRIAFSTFVHLIRTASNTLETPDFQVAKIARIVENRHWLL